MSSNLEQALIELRQARAALAERSEPAFDARLAALREWQARNTAALHRPLAERYDGEDLLHFLTRSFYLEADWSELTADPGKIANRIGRIIDDHRPLVIAVRLQHTADTLDADMAEQLETRTPDQPITRKGYVAAFREVGRFDVREQQIGWVGELVDLLGGFADNRAAYWAFKLASSPAKALGMGQTYGLLAEGFSAMRNTRDLETATREALTLQRRELDRLIGRTAGSS
ncbi:hypothetical protein T5B8_11856 [Salinisphaera sp. T5B8]|uniref:FFLEELY motif protein n=1 Tax=Salinisphaera sp. T5B8 TaxID=1304154 RepID=UPI003340DE6C